MGDFDRAEQVSYCGWKYDKYDEAWETGCGNIFSIYDGGPYENGLKYCAYCGKQLRELQADEDEQEST